MGNGIDLNWLQESFPYLSNIEPLPPSGQKWSFKCLHPKYELSVLKLVKPWAVERLDRELEAVRRLTKLSSGNVPMVYKVGVVESPVGELIFLFEEYVAGTNLKEKLRNGALKKNEILRLAHGLLAAAVNAEAANTVHRDIKPANIIVDESFTPYLLDFGIARILDLESKTRSDAVSGPHTPGYSAPEQFIYQKDKIDSRSDLFAIGVILFESATGINPFTEGARDRIEILRRVELEPLPLLKLEWDEDGSLSEFVSTMTQKFPYQRPRSCQDALEWIEDIISNYGEID